MMLRMLYKEKIVIPVAYSWVVTERNYSLASTNVSYALPSLSLTFSNHVWLKVSFDFFLDSLKFDLYIIFIQYFFSFFILQFGTTISFIVHEKISEDVWVFTLLETNMTTEFCIKHIFYFNVVQITKSYSKCRNIIFWNGMFS